jgi:hypothetical protein
VSCVGDEGKKFYNIDPRKVFGTKHLENWVKLVKYSKSIVVMSAFTWSVELNAE